MKWLVENIEAGIVGLANSMRRTKRAVDAESRSNDGTIGTTQNGKGFTLLPSDMARSVHIVGTTGSGKTCVVIKILELDILRESTVVVVDLRGDLVAAVVALCTALEVDPERITILDLRQRRIKNGFNPLSGAGKSFIKALHILSVLESSSATWGVSLEEYCRNGLLVLTEAGLALTDMEALFYDEPFLCASLECVGDESVRAFWLRYLELSKEKRRVIASSVLNKLSSLTCIDALREVLGSKHPINLESILGTPGQILLVSCAIDELHKSGAMFGSLIVAAISREMLSRVDIPQAKRNPVRLIVDEFENMAGEPFEELVQEGRRFNCTCCLSHQQYSQLPAKLKSLILANCGIRILFQLGFEDAKTVASELSSDVSIATLRKQKPGQAIVLRRDGSTVQVQFHPPRKNPASKDIEAYRSRIDSSIPPTFEMLEPAKPAVKTSAPDMEDWL